ncbi:hypothetical protein CHARACLAT_004252 [Characodon lateralis]|uniref:Zona pellucida sperm-binding protein 1/4 Ig-like domain-containing protein n=1 Tax=Characodon lateralis TaxID=208331 RepID=A0ABU7DN94_9TELE|nr:hypothetical protein [Characodon lateralis]
MAMESLLKMESKVECTQDSMKLLVHDVSSTPVSLIFVDRGHLSPLSLTKLPSSCGYTIRSTQKDLVLVAPYDGCFVIIQENYYVLPLLWWGLPVRMSCPLMGHVPQNPPMVTCHAEGMVVKTEWTASASKIKANVNGNWESLLTAAQRCIFGIVEHPDGVVISVSYAPCLMKKDGMYTLELAADVETKKPAVTRPPQPATQAQEKRQELKRLREGTSSHPPGNINYMQRDGDTSSSTHFSDSNSVSSYTEQSFSAEQLNPEVLKSFESLWKSVTPSDFSQLFLAHVPGKTELFQERKNSALNQLAKEMDKPLQMVKKQNRN